MSLTGKLFPPITRIGAAVGLTMGLALLLLSGCHGGSDDQGSGILRVALTDAPACGFDAVNVTVSKVRVHQSDTAAEQAAGWAEIVLDPGRKINLLDLTNGTLEELGQIPLAVGHYTQLRLVLGENDGPTLANSVVPATSGSELPLDTPSAMQSGLKLIHPFDVAAGERVDLALDFDACKSVVRRGNGSYGLKPVLRVIPFSLNGIAGFVAPALLDKDVAVSAQSGGTVVRATVPNPQTGEFYLARLEPGNYDVVVTAAGYATAVIADVPIPDAFSTANLSSSTAPLTLSPSATQTVSGTIVLTPPSATAVAEAMAKQSFPSGPTVTVLAQTVDLLGNAYSMTLPTAAAQLGFYGSGVLPIGLSAVAATAAQYTIEAAAAGYQPQGVGLDLAAGAAIQDFVLTP